MRMPPPRVVAWRGLLHAAFRPVHEHTRASSDGGARGARLGAGGWRAHGSMWCSHMEKIVMSRTSTISWCDSCAVRATNGKQHVVILVRNKGLSQLDKDNMG